ncbi:MAG TPA: hypothetical protein VNQ79_06625 [Blastocatellia bacterium]|nr:hypothetical protein [Blastocatellia bacterium]
MQKCDPELLAVLRLTDKPRELVELYEIFTRDEDERTPARAVARWANSAITFQGLEYERRVISRGEVKRYLDKQVNTLSLTLSNVDLAMTRFVNAQRLEGMWLQMRLVSRLVPDGSLILFGGFCDKPDELNHQTCQLTVRQDFGSDQDLLRRQMTILCPLRFDFKGEACRGGVPLASKSAEYQAAVRCNGSYNQCLSYSNTDNFQGFRFQPVSGTFQYETVEQKRFLLFFTRKKKRIVSAPWSSVSDLSEETYIPETAGIAQVEGVPLMHADTGAKVRFLQAFAAEDSDGIFELRVRDKQYLPAPDNAHTALGEWGSQGQPESLLFTGAGRFSGVTWAEGEAVGSDPNDANDAAPTVTAIVRGRRVDYPDASGQFTLKQWTDSGPLLARWYLTNRGTAKASDIDDESILEAFHDCNEPVIDDTGFEQVIIPEQVTGGSIQGFRAFASASGFGAATVDRIALMLAQGKIPTGGYGQLVQAYYRYISQTNIQQFISPVRKVRRRYTTNFTIKEQTSLGDFLWDVLLQSFNGRLVYGANGKIQIRVDKPADVTYLREPAAAGATQIEVEDARRWSHNIGAQILIGAHLPNSEIRRVTDYGFSTLGNQITLQQNTAGTITATLSGATLSGADATHPATGTITLGGTVSDGAKVELWIDGIKVDYTAQAGDDIEAIAGYLAATINGEVTLRRYVRAEWNLAQGSVIRIVSKLGFLKLDAPLAEPHFQLEECIRVAAAFGGEGQAKLIKDSVSWPLGSRQSSTNYVYGKFRSQIHDWAPTAIEDEAEAHVKQVGKTSKEEINLSAVVDAHQAFRLLRIRLGKRRLCDWFVTLQASGDALLLDVGDVICVTHYSGAEFIRNVPVTIEDISIDSQHRARITARLYRSEVYDDTIRETGAPILMPLQPGSTVNTSGDPPNQPVSNPNTGNSGTGGSPVVPPYSSGSGGYGSGGSRDFDQPIGL